MEVVTVTAEKRSVLGKGAVNRLRRQGFVPGILYGEKCGNVPVAIDEKEFRKVELGTGKVFKVVVAGEQEHSVIVREMQRDPVSRRLTHVDLLEVSMNEPIEVIVPIRIEGEAKGEKVGGVLQHGLREVEIKCLPKDIPEAITVDISALDIGDSIKVEDLVPPAGVTVLTEPDQLVVTVIAAQHAEAVEEEGEGAAPEAAEAPAAE
ncbi:MAG TPA: 50S ribosomal protein L25/general stress protein Ctc [Clostridia bacterium]|nr:50S ribosomal protein L25/general stress protein Ctc [Clostridia bacterium]